MVGLGGVGPEVDREFGLNTKEVAPFHGPVGGELVALEEAVNKGGALVGIGVFEELRGLLGGGERADGVEVDAAEEDGVGAEAGRRDAQAVQVREHERIDLAFGGGIGGAFEEGMLRTRAAERRGQGDANQTFRQDNTAFTSDSNPAEGEKSRPLQVWTGAAESLGKQEIFFRSWRAVLLKTKDLVGGAQEDFSFSLGFAG